jgi:hypothetical protein
VLPVRLSKVSAFGGSSAQVCMVCCIALNCPWRIDCMQDDHTDLNALNNLLLPPARAPPGLFRCLLGLVTASEGLLWLQKIVRKEFVMVEWAAQACIGGMMIDELQLCVLSHMSEQRWRSPTNIEFGTASY